MQQDGMRVLQPLPHAADWFGCFDLVQLNEDEMQQLSPDPLTLAAQALGAGVSLLTVTLGPRGVAYVAAPGSIGWRNERTGSSARAPRSPVPSPFRRSIPAPLVEALDPTGCGDVFGAAALPGSWLAIRSRRHCAMANGAGRPERRLSRGHRAGQSPARRAGDPVTRVIEVPAHFDDRSFDTFAAGFGEWPPARRCCSMPAPPSGPPPTG